MQANLLSQQLKGTVTGEEKLEIIMILHIELLSSYKRGDFQKNVLIT